MQTATTAELSLIKTAPTLKRVTRLELVSRSDPNDVRQLIDTGASDYDPEETGILDGGVSADVNRDALRSCSLSLVDWTKAWFPGPGNSVWLDAMLKVYRGYEGTQAWPQGVYEIVDPQISGPYQVQLNGVDKTARANGRDMGGFTTIFSIAKSTNLKTALESLAAYDTWGETLLNLAATALVMPFKREWGLTDHPWAAAKAVADIPGDYRLYFDERGYLTWTQDPDPNLLTPSWLIWPEGSRPGTALPGEFSFLVESAKQIDAQQLRNWVGVSGGSAKATPIYATASDTDAASQTAIAKIGHRAHWWNGGRPDPLITTAVEAQARADYELRKLKQWHERVPLRIAELPILQPWDVIRVTDPEVGLNDTYQVVSYNLPLAGSAEMQLQAWRVRRAV